jgi:hypothetical protein
MGVELKGACIACWNPTYRYFLCNHRVSINATVNPSLRFCQVLVLTAQAHRTVLMTKPGNWEHLGDIEEDSLGEKIGRNSK